MRIFIAGASGVIGSRLVPLLVAEGHAVAGMTRSRAKIGALRELGAQAVLCDVFDADALTEAVTGFRPEVPFHQLTDLPVVLSAGGVIIRYGQLYGPGTYEDKRPDPPRVHVDEAARRTLPVLEAPAGLTVVIDDRSTVGEVTGS